MVAGRGISHQELSTPETSILQGAQLWFALPESTRHMPPTFEHGVLLDTGDLRLDGGKVPVDHLVYLPTGRSSLVLEAGVNPVRVLVIGGEPLGEQIIMWWNFIGRTHEEVVVYRNAWQAEIGAGAATMPDGGTYPDGAPHPRFGPFPENMPDPLPAPALPNVQPRPRG